MVYVPYSPEHWITIEAAYRLAFPDDRRKHLPIREVAEWWAGDSITRLEKSRAGRS
jgi:hypothetical protein